MRRIVGSKRTRRLDDGEAEVRRSIEADGGEIEEARGSELVSTEAWREVGDDDCEVDAGSGVEELEEESLEKIDEGGEGPRQGEGAADENRVGAKCSRMPSARSSKSSGLKCSGRQSKR